MKLTILSVMLFTSLFFTSLGQAGVFGQRNVIFQSFAAANGTQQTGNNDRSVTFVASGATVAAIGGVAITMIAGEVLPIQAQSQDTLRSITFSVTSGALIVIEQQ